MEFQFNASRVLAERVTILNGGKRHTEVGRENEHQLETIINSMGGASAKAQGLKSPITTYSKLVQSNDQCLFILREGNAVVGFIKTGRRRLFLWDHTGLIHEVVPVCILDFYVHESQQRKGYGKYLFEQVLQRDDLQPFEIAIDRPSIKFLKFLQKHYNLHSYIKQNNNYVVFKKFFSTCVHYDHGQRQVQRRVSLPNQIDRPPIYKNGSSNRLSLSPRRSGSSKMDENLPSSGQSSFHSIATPPSKTSLTGSEKPSSGKECQLPKRHCFNSFKNDVNSINNTGAEDDNHHWSQQQGCPVPSNRHAPFLTMRGQPRQRSLNSFLGIGANHLRGTFAPGHNNDRYSRYEIGRSRQNHLLLTQAVTPPYGTDSWQVMKKRPWKEHLQ